MSKKGVPPSYPVQSNQMASGSSAPPSYEEAMKHQVVHGQQTVPMNGPYHSNPVHQVPAGYPPGSAPGYAYGPQHAGQPNYNNPYPQAAQVNPMFVQQVPVAGTVYVQPGSFDGGARFNKISRPVVPPPPPGVMPNAAQLGAMQGASVTVAQKNGKTTLTNFVMGKSDGGSTFW